MGALNIFSITFGGVELGGAGDYQLHKPYVVEKSYDSFRLVFAVVITAPDHEELQARSSALEDLFRRRLRTGETLLISLNGNDWTYVVGTDVLKVTSSLSKSGDDVVDTSYSRQYTASILAQLPANDQYDDGLRSIEAHADNSPSNQTTVTMSGVYTATASGDAVTNYTNKIDAQAALYLTFFDSSATFELVKEDFDSDRERTGGLTPYPHVCNFTRQYVQLLVTQNTGLGASSLDDAQIRDSKITFSDVGSFTGDGVPNLFRMRRMTGTYDCAVNSVLTLDLQTVVSGKIKPTILSLFQSEFRPRVFCIEDFRLSYDESSKRISCTFTFLFQQAGGQAVVEVAYAVAYHENRHIDYTPTHQADELSAYADVGWLILERIFTRRVLVVGTETPKLRISEDPFPNDAGLFKDTVTDEPGPDNRPGTKLNQTGWNMISSSSEVVPNFVGDAVSGRQLEMCQLTETTTERFHRAPQRTITQTGQRGPATPNG